MIKKIITAKQAMFINELEKKVKARNIAALFLFIGLTKDYLPKKHEEFDEWQINFVAETTPLLGTWGILIGNPDWVAVTTNEATWNAAWAAAMPFITTRTHPLVVAMDTAFDNYRTALRYFIQNYLAANKNVTPTQRALIGITIRKTTRTYHPVPLDRVPDGKVNRVAHLSHELLLTDPNTPESKRKPVGAKEYYVYMTVADQGVTPVESDFEFVGGTTSSKYIAVFDLSQVGKRAHYFVKWVDTKNNEGNPSDWFDQTIL